MIKNNKGFTMIEVILAVTIAGVIISSLTLFFTVSLGSFKLSKSLTDLQYEGQTNMNQLSDILLHSSGFYAFETLTDDVLNDTTYINYSSGVTPKEFIIKTPDFQYKFIYDYAAETIEYVKIINNVAYNFDPANDEKILFARTVTGFSLVPINEVFARCEGVKISMTLEKGGQSTTMVEEVRFRNK